MSLISPRDEAVVAQNPHDSPTATVGDGDDRDPTDRGPTDDRPVLDPVEIQRLRREKYNDPRVRVTRRGVWAAIGVVVAAVMMTAGTLYFRRTLTEQSAEFWGDETIRAFQLASKVELVGISDDPRYRDKIDITTMPGLGHVRRAMLDQRHYDWTTRCDDPVATDPSATIDDDLPAAVRLQFSDPLTGRFAAADVVIDLENGWAGPHGGSSRVKFTDHVRPKIRRHLTTVLNFEPIREADKSRE